MIIYIIKGFLNPLLLHPCALSDSKGNIEQKTLHWFIFFVRDFFLWWFFGWIKITMIKRGPLVRNPWLHTFVFPVKTDLENVSTFENIALAADKRCGSPTCSEQSGSDKNINGYLGALMSTKCGAGQKSENWDSCSRERLIFDFPGDPTITGNFQVIIRGSKKQSCS